MNFFNNIIKNKMKKKYTRWLVWALVSIATISPLLPPLYFYYDKFGLGYWKEHQDWAHLGSYFGGVIGPLVTFISVLYLGFQLRQQVKQNRREADVRRCELLIKEAKDSAVLLSKRFDDVDFLNCLKSEVEAYIGNDSNLHKERATKFCRDNLRLYYEFLILESVLVELYELDHKTYDTVRWRVMAHCDLDGLGAFNRIVNEKHGTNKKLCISLR
ncbi:hypothetical protein AKJ18_04250 [Vibrio xuii]|nr:hypothetical protein AKJ18_04250 [Vibrio xuii]